MTFHQPWALGLLALAIPIVVVYLLRGQPIRRPTGAAFLWRGLEQQVTARRHWRRPPLSLALLLQLLALAGGVLALAQPAAGQSSARQLFYLLDASPSMQATDVPPSRFESARVAVRESIAGLQPGDVATIVRVGPRPEVLASGSQKPELLKALEQARPGLAPVSLRDALALVAARAQRPIGEGSAALVYTDGTLADPLGVAPLPLPVRFVTIGQGGDNQGISSLLVRRAAGESNRLAGFAQVSNYSDTPTRLPVRLLADGLLLETRVVDLAGRGRTELPFDLPPSARSVAAQLGGRDSLSLDDRVEVSVPENRTRRAVLASRSPQAWEQALQVLPGLDLQTVWPAAFRDEGVELTVLDGYLPERLPGGQLLVVNPPPGNPLIEVLGEARDAQLSPLDPSHPLLRSLDLAAIQLVRAQRLGVPRWGQVVASTRSGAAIVAGEVDGRRVVVLGFDPLASGLEKLVAFPILVANAVDYLEASGLEPMVAPGQRVSLPIAVDAGEAVLERPDGSRQLLASRGAVQLEALDQVGRYTLRQRSAGGEPTSRGFFVNLVGEAEADTAPRAVEPWPPAEPLQPLAERLAPPFWTPFALAALLLLACEWLFVAARS